MVAVHPPVSLNVDALNMSGCSDPAVMAVHLHLHISWKQCRCSGLVPPFVSLNVDVVNISGCSDPAVIAVHLHLHISWKECRCSGCSTAFCVPEGECSADAVYSVYLKVYAGC